MRRRTGNCQALSKQTNTPAVVALPAATCLAAAVFLAPVALPSPASVAAFTSTLLAAGPRVEGDEEGGRGHVVGDDQLVLGVPSHVF